MAGDEAEAEFRTGLHPIVFVGALTMAGLVALATLLVIRNNDLAPTTNLLVALGGGLLALSAVLPTAMRWRRGTFRATPTGFAGRVGWWRPQVFEWPWSTLADVDFDQTWLGSRLGYGTVRLLTREQAVECFSHVANAPALVAVLRRRLGGRPTQRAAR
jgi:Bacterial PH domain